MSTTTLQPRPLPPFPKPSRVNAPPVAFKFYVRAVVMRTVSTGWVSLPDRRQRGEKHMRRVLGRFWKYTRPRGSMTIEGEGLKSQFLNVNIDIHMGVL